MPHINSYWLDDRNAPYATFLSILQTYVHPEVDELEALQEVAKRIDVPEMVTFKKEFREVIANPNVLPEGAVSTASAYEDGTDEAFLARLWRDLYGDEPANPDG